MRNKAGAWFNGENAYIEIYPSESLNITEAITVEVWLNFHHFRLTDVISSGLYRLYHRGSWLNGYIFFLYSIVESDSPGDSIWHHWGGVKIPQKLSEEQWYHIVGVKSGDTMSIYLNGIKERELTCLTGYTISSFSEVGLYVGLYMEAARFNGSIALLRIYNRALNPDEIMSLYSSRNVRRGLVVHHDYRLGHTLDLSGNSNHGIPHNVQFVGVYTKKGLWCPGQDNAYVEIPEAVINGDEDYTVAVEFVDIQPGFLFQHGNDLIIELEGKTLKAYRINSASEQETVSYTPSQLSGTVIIRKVGNTLSFLWNGISVDSISLSGSVLPDTTRRIGSGLRGNIKRVITYRRALGDGEIFQLMNKRIPPRPSLFYDFTLGHANDLSGNGIDGNPVNVKFI